MKKMQLFSLGSWKENTRAAAQVGLNVLEKLGRGLTMYINMIYLISTDNDELSQFNTLEELELALWQKDSNHQLVCIEGCPVLRASDYRDYSDLIKALESCQRTYQLCNLQGEPIETNGYITKHFPAFVESYNKKHEKFRWKLLGEVNDQVSPTPSQG
jgi:hypothetical protein